MSSIAEGGEKLKTDMPAYKDVLTEKERWQIIHYLHEGL
ncbi:MAG: c-type cytochrome [Hyphomicrobiaceae bacterium]